MARLARDHSIQFTVLTGADEVIGEHHVKRRAEERTVRCAASTRRRRPGECPANVSPLPVAFRHNRLMAVKRTRRRTETYELDPAALYRDDLEQIAKAVAEVGPLKVEFGGWELTDPADFSNPDLPERLPDLTMSAERPNDAAKIEVLLGRRYAEVVVTEPDTPTLGVMSRVQQVCRSRRRPYIRRLFRDVIIATVAVTAAVLATDALTDDLAIRAIVLAPVGVLILGLTFIYWSKSSNRHYTSLVNAYRKDRPTFWQRSRDDWIVGVVMLLLGGVLGYLVNQIT